MPYLMSIFGTPSALTRWTVNVSIAIARKVSEDYKFIATSSLEDTWLAWQTKTSGSVILHSVAPQRSLVDFFTQYNFPIVFVSEPLLRVVFNVSEIRNLDLITSMKITTQSICTIFGLLNCEFVFRISEFNYSEGAIGLILRLIEFYGLHLEGENFNSLLHELQLIDNPDMSVEEIVRLQFPDYNCDVSRDHFKFTEDVRFIIAQYECMLAGTMPNYFIWPPPVFYRFQPDVSYLDGPLDMVGPARELIGGHSLCLPQGRWRARVLIEISNNMSGNKLSSDVFTENTIFATVIARLPKQGVFYYEIDFACSDPFVAIIVRIAITEGAIEGMLTLRQIEFTKIHDRVESKQ